MTQASDQDLDQRCIKFLCTPASDQVHQAAAAHSGFDAANRRAVARRQPDNRRTGAPE